MSNAERFTLHCPSAGSELKLISLEGSEALSELFSCTVSFAVADLGRVDLPTILNQPAHLSFEPLLNTLPGMAATGRHWAGIVTHARYLGEQGNYNKYELILRPSLWRLTKRADCRIFQQVSVVQVIDAVLADAGFSSDDYRWVLQETHAEREYCVQYRESDYDFIARLMAEEGIWFTFEHAEGRHTLVMSDTPTIENPIPDNEILRYAPPGGGNPEDEHVNAFTGSRAMATGAWVHTDYDFKRPRVELETEQTAERFNELSWFDYPARYNNAQQGGLLARLRLEQEQVNTDTASGTAQSVRFAAGMQFTLAQADEPTMDRRYLLTRVSHSVEQPGVLGAQAGEQPPSHAVSFDVIPATTPYRGNFNAIKTTPHVTGPHTAKVVGPEGEEIYVDEHGRVKVQFHWDRYGQSNEHSSVWMRVSQGWGGAGWGQMFIPRIGHEVIVDFLEGDIDRPLITGRVYNGENVPPYPLPANKTVSTIKTQTHKGQGSNELRFEDEAGREQVYLHAQKDEDRIVENDRREWVKANRNLTVGAHKLEQVLANHYRTVEGAEYLAVHKDQSLQIHGNQAESVDGSQALEVGANSLLKAGKNIVLQAGEALTIQAAGGFITIDAAGVHISGKVVNVNSGGAPTPPQPIETTKPEMPDQAQDGIG